MGGGPGGVPIGIARGGGAQYHRAAVHRHQQGAARREAERPRRAAWAGHAAQALQAVRARRQPPNNAAVTVPCETVGPGRA